MIALILFLSLSLTDIDFLKHEINNSIIEGFYDGSPPSDAYLIR